METSCGSVNRLLVGPSDTPPWFRLFRLAAFLAVAAGAYLASGVLVLGSAGRTVVVGSVVLGGLAALSVSAGTVLIGVSLLRETE